MATGALKCVCNQQECDVIRAEDCPGMGMVVMDPCKLVSIYLLVNELYIIISFIEIHFMLCVCFWYVLLMSQRYNFGTFPLGC